MVNVRPRVRPRVRKNFLYDVGRHFLQKVSRVVGHQIIDNARGLLVGQRTDNILLIIDLELRENIRRHTLR